MRISESSGSSEEKTDECRMILAFWLFMKSELLVYERFCYCEQIRIINPKNAI